MLLIDTTTSGILRYLHTRSLTSPLPISAKTARNACTPSEWHHPGELPALVAQPVSIEEVCQLVRAASAQGVPVVGYGAGTSLEGNAAALTSDRSEEHTSELQSLMRISYAVFCLKKKNKSIQKSE